MVSLDGRKTAVLVGLLLAFGLDQASAQQPSSAQINAIRQSCRSDFMSNCSGVQPGGKDAIECLERNLGKLSAPCKTAVSAVAPKPPAPAAAASPAPAPAATTPEPASSTAPAAITASQQEQVRAIQEACTISDFTSHCSWIKPDSPEVLLCLQANAAQLSPNCQTAVRGLPAAEAPAATAIAPTPGTAAEPAARPAAPRPAALPTRTPQAVARPAPRPPAAPAAAAAAPQQPTPEQTAAIRAACRSDFMSHCSGVQPGGAEALQCLQRNSAQLSAPCGTAVSAIAKGGAAAPAAAAATATAPAPAAAPFVPRRLRLIEELAILKSCGADQRAFCAGVAPGGGRVIGCLAQNASSLSPQCAGALAAAR
jgi:hypothetical protein